VDSSHDGRIRVGDAAHHGRRHHGYLHPSGRILDNFRVFDKDGAGITLGEFLRILNELDEDKPNAASCRFAASSEKTTSPVSRCRVSQPPLSSCLEKLF
jgi:hypothetical protein